MRYPFGFQTPGWNVSPCPVPEYTLGYTLEYTLIARIKETTLGDPHAAHRAACGSLS